MNVKLFQIVWLLLFPFYLLAQVPEINWGEEVKQKGLMFTSKITLGTTSDHYYILNWTKNSTQVYQYDFKHQLISKNPIDYTVNSKAIDFNQIITTASASYMIGYSMNKKTQETTVFTYEIKKDGSLSSQKRDLFSFSFNTKSFIIADDGGNKDATGISVSNDGKKVLFVTVSDFKERSIKKKDEDDKSDLSLFVFDENLQPIWNNSLKTSFSDKEMNLNQFQINNEGQPRLLVRVKKKKEKGEEEAKTGFYLYEVASDGTFKSTRIKHEEVHFKNVSMHQYDDGSFNISGFYARKGDKKKIKINGIYFNKYNKNCELLFTKLNEFDDDFYQKIEELPKNKQFGSPKVFLFRIDHMLVNNENESFTCIAENRFTVREIDKTSTGREMKFRYYSKQLLVYSLSFEGDLNWVKWIDKYYDALDKNRNMFSYLFGHYKGTVCLIFNDEKTLAERRKSTIKGKLLTLFTDIIQIDNTGEIILQETFFTSNQILGAFEPHNSRLLRDGKLLIYSADNKKYNYGLLNLNSQ